MKPKNQSKEYEHMNTTGHSTTYEVESHLPPRWWLHPVFDFGLHYPAPYIWFAYWLITWEEEIAHPFHMFRMERRFKKIGGFYHLLSPAFHFIKVSISFMPD